MHRENIQDSEVYHIQGIFIVHLSNISFEFKLRMIVFHLTLTFMLFSYSDQLEFYDTLNIITFSHSLKIKTWNPVPCTLNVTGFYSHPVLKQYHHLRSSLISCFVEIITDVNKGIDEVTDGIVDGTGDTIKGIAHGLGSAANGTGSGLGVVLGGVGDIV